MMRRREDLSLVEDVDRVYRWSVHLEGAWSLFLKVWLVWVLAVLADLTSLHLLHALLASLAALGVALLFARELRWRRREGGRA